MKKFLQITTLVFALLLVANIAAAALVPDACRGADTVKDCTLGTLKDLIANVINFLLGFSGIICLLFMVWGGVQMLLSGGNPDAIKKGKGTISNALLGLAIVLGSYLIINIVVGVLSNGSIPGLKDLLKFW